MCCSVLMSTLISWNFWIVTHVFSREEILILNGMRWKGLNFLQINHERLFWGLHSLPLLADRCHDCTTLCFNYLVNFYSIGMHFCIKYWSQPSSFCILAKYLIWEAFLPKFNPDKLLWDPHRSSMTLCKTLGIPCVHLRRCICHSPPDTWIPQHGSSPVRYKNPKRTVFVS